MSLSGIRRILLISLFAALTALGGWIRIPFVPVPLTMQTLFVYLSGMWLGKTAGFASQVVYLAAGLAGLPVFSAGGGPAYVLHPTFGYLVGFPCAAWVLGALFEKAARPGSRRMLLWAGAGSVLIILGTGMLGLYANLNWISGRPVSFTQVLWTGFVVFLPGECIKFILAAVLYRRLRNAFHCDGDGFE
ncbi:biotin transporter BioY [bacterium]|nr:biotin transporter BioY [bacterium]